MALRVTEQHLKLLNGAVRSLWTMGLVTLLLGSLCLLALQGSAGQGIEQWVQRSLHWPVNLSGWLGLAGLTLCYGSAFSLLFAIMPRLDMARNAPAANIEPVAALIFGWLLLGQTLNLMQLLGAALVVTGIMALALSGRQPS